MTDEACRALTELLDEQVIHMVPAQFLTYLIDGATLTLPLAKSTVDYKQPHWLPVVLRPVPHPDQRKRKVSRAEE